jgi:hypothetical protein
MLIITDLVYDLPRYIRKIHTRSGLEPRRDEHDSSRYSAFRNDPRIGILLKEMVDDGVAYLVTKFVGMAFRNRF